MRFRSLHAAVWVVWAAGQVMRRVDCLAAPRLMLEVVPALLAREAAVAASLGCSALAMLAVVVEMLAAVTADAKLQSAD